jgi:amidophosphoribosyltransferase
MTNVKNFFKVLVELGQHPKKEMADTVTVMEKGHFLMMKY